MLALAPLVALSLAACAAAKGEPETTTTPYVDDPAGPTDAPPTQLDPPVDLTPRFDENLKIQNESHFDAVMAEIGAECPYYPTDGAPRPQRSFADALAALENFAQYWDADFNDDGEKVKDVVEAAIVAVSSDEEQIARVNWNTLNEEQKANVLSAFKCVQASGADVALASIHALEAGGLHGGPGFLPGHHAYVRVIETILHTKCGMDSKFVPYLNYLDESKPLEEEISVADMKTMVAEVSSYKVRDQQLELADREQPSAIAFSRKVLKDGYEWETETSVAVACFLEMSPVHIAPHNDHGWPMMNPQWSPLDLVLFTMHHAFIDSLFAAFVARRTDAYYPHVDGSGNPHGDDETMALFNGQTYTQVWDRVRQNGKVDLVDGFRQDQNSDVSLGTSPASTLRNPLAELRALLP